MLNRIKSASDSILLDLASGPGRVTLKLAPYFSKVLANDVDSEMISVGKSEAVKCKINNIEWLIGKAEELMMESNSIDLITIGEAFHRLDQNRITNLSLRWLKPGSYIALMGCFGLYDGNEVWQNVIKKIISKWTVFGKRKSSRKKSTRNPEQYKNILQDKGFENSNIYSFDFPHY